MGLTDPPPLVNLETLYWASGKESNIKRSRFWITMSFAASDEVLNRTCAALGLDSGGLYPKSYLGAPSPIYDDQFNTPSLFSWARRFSFTKVSICWTDCVVVSIAVPIGNSKLRVTIALSLLGMKTKGTYLNKNIEQKNIKSIEITVIDGHFKQ